MAEAVGVTLRAYQDWEASSMERPKGIDWENAKKLAKFFGVDPEDVARREDEAEPGPFEAELAQMREQLTRVEKGQQEILAQLTLLITAINATAEEPPPERESKSA